MALGVLPPTKGTWRRHLHCPGFAPALGWDARRDAVQREPLETGPTQHQAPPRVGHPVQVTGALLWVGTGLPWIHF